MSLTTSESLSPSPGLPALGRYEVVAHLASGGMAEILLGRVRGPSGFERPVVLKRILPHLTRQRGFVDMFLDEARIIAAIRHPNVVQVQELLRENGELFLVMEYLEGETLSALLRHARSSGGLPPHLSAYILAEALAGLHAAHELSDNEGRTLGLVHRDVSPQNIFVTYSGNVKLLDFGVAKVANRITHTRAGEVKGKVAYMSPEQCIGAPLDRRSDVFAAGTVLFEMLSNRILFRRANDVATMHAVLEERIPRLSTVVPGCAREVEQIVERALTRDVERRYQTAREMRLDLETFARQQRLESAPQEELGALMGTLFAKRSSEKTELLRRVRDGSFAPSAPTHGEWAEALPSVSLSELVSSQITHRSDPLTRPQSWAVAAAVAMVITLAATVSWVTLREATARPAAPPPVQSPAAAEVTISIETTPSGAEVLLAGVPRGVTPLELKLSSSSSPAELELRKDGFLAEKRALVATQNEKLNVVLRARPAQAADGPEPAARAPLDTHR